MPNWFTGLIGLFLRIFFQPRASQEAIVSKEAGTAEAELISNQKEENALAKASAARVDADNAAIVRGGNHVTTDPTAAINNDPNAHYRD